MMPISVMAASITTCNNMSMENLKPGGVRYLTGQISDGSDIRRVRYLTVQISERSDI